MKARTLVTLVTVVGATMALTACTPAVTACTVRHHYAIVIFENGGGGVGKTFIKQFRLNVKYSPYYVQHQVVNARIVLRPVRGNQLPVAIKTYPVGHARSCRVDRIKTHQ